MKRNVNVFGISDKRGRREKRDDQLVLETTASNLSERLGRALQHAHSGELKSDWGGKQTCRGDWQRDE